MSLVEELPEDQPGFSSKPSDSDEAAVTHAEAGTSGEHAEAQLLRDVEEDERLLVQARAAKERGNAHFKAGELPEALECYSEAIELAAPTEVEEVGVFFANRAAVFSRMAQHQAVCDDCDAALQRQPGYVKALLRRAQAKEALDQPSEALADMKKALEIEPGAKAAALDETTPARPARPRRPERLVGRGWPRLGAAWGVALTRREAPERRLAVG